MKTPIITLACAALASFAFLACDMGGYTSECQAHKKPLAKVNVLSKTCSEGRCWYDESDSIFFKPRDPNWIRIEESVKEWMEEQFATESNDTMLFVVMDFFIHENFVNTFDISGPIEQEYYIDGVRASYEEYIAVVQKNEEYKEERAARGKRDLPIPREGIMYETDYATSGTWVGVPMTAKQIAELTENYKDIAIEFYMEAYGGNGGNGYIEDDDDSDDDDYNRPAC